MKNAYSKAADRHVRKEVRKVRAPKLAHLVAEQLREQIAVGDIKPGDTLPSEGKLLEQFGISRPTLREALRVLESETLIQLGRGARSGATVLGPSIEAIARRSILYLAVQGTTLAEVLQARILLEPSIAALLAERSKKPFIAAFRRCNEQQAQALRQKDYATLLARVNEFHDLLMTFSENRALSLVAGILHSIVTKLNPQVLLAGDRRSQHSMFVKRCEMAVEAHTQLTRLIAAGKAAEAEKFWRKYMASLGQYFAASGMANLRVHVSRGAH
jgi:GntR family transcriptional repressor for pyruvate dehydrogenase complex